MTNPPLRTKTKLPLIRLSLCIPFLLELERRHIDTNAVLASNGLSREAMYDDEVFVPAIVVHRFLEAAADAAQDSYLGVFIGENLEYSAWAPFRDAVTNSKFLLDFLTRFIRVASQDASSAKHSLEIRNDYALFKETRVGAPEIAPSQNDAFTLAYVLNIIRRGSGDKWDPRQVFATVCTPEVIPDRYLGVTITGGDRMGISIRFPSAWLHHTIDVSQFGILRKHTTSDAGPPPDFINALRSTIALHLEEERLGVESIARLISYSKQTLQRKLKSHGTTLSKEIASLKRDRAIELLVHSSTPIWKIAESLGYSSQPSFTRAFKSWTNQTPREYRKKHQNEV
jgi:AraC-like DNA-binding protein